MSEHDAPQSPQLRQSLESRHVTLIALGGMIGGGFFIGSGAVISSAGPAALITYALAAFLIILVMRALGEMAVARPGRGTFATYAHDALGPAAGFVSGWLYWYFWAVVIAYEAIAAGKIIEGWLPGTPAWLVGAGFIAVMTVVNLLSVRAFGEFEFWFAATKVIAIFVFFFIVVLSLVGIGLGSDNRASFATITGSGGLIPNGVAPILTAIATVFFAMQGGEIATIAAAESSSPGRAVARATQLIVARQAIFFLLSVFLILCAVSWTSIPPGESPFAAALDGLGIPAAGTIMSAVVLIAVLSCLNSGIYITSRMLFGMAQKGQAPRWTMRVSRRGVPVFAVLAATVIGYLGVAGAVISPDGIFLFLLNSSGAVMLIVYILIAASQLKMRRELERTDPGALTLKMWLFPYLTILAIVAMLAVLIGMALDSSLRTQLLASVGSLVVIVVAYVLTQREHRWRSAPRAVAGVPPSDASAPS